VRIYYIAYSQKIGISETNLLIEGLVGKTLTCTEEEEASSHVVR
jgi:hypothetical protein